MGSDRERFRLGLTEAGKAVLRGTAYVALAAVVVPAFGALCALVCVLLMALAVGLLLRPRVSVEGHLPERTVAGQPVRLTYVLRNMGRSSAYNVCVGFAALPETIELVGSESVIPHLGPGERAEVTLTIRPTRRGRYRIGRPICRSGFPFNLFWFGVSHSGQETLMVLPAFWRLQMPVLRLSRHVHSSGTRLASRVGACPEYVGNRPFMPGDSPRRIDARAWARLAAPATKEYDEDCDNYAAIVLDTYVPASESSKSQSVREFEAAVSFCASAAFTVNDDCFIDLLLAGDQLHGFTGQPRAARLDRIHELLAEVEPSQVDLAERTILSLTDRFSEMSQVVFVFLRWDAVRERLLELAERAGCRCIVVLIGEPGNSSSPGGTGKLVCPWTCGEGIPSTSLRTGLPLSSGATARRMPVKQGRDGLATQGRDALATMNPTEEPPSNKFGCATRPAAHTSSQMDWEDMGTRSGRTIRVLSADEVLSGQVRPL